MKTTESKILYYMQRIFYHRKSEKNMTKYKHYLIKMIEI